MHGMCSGMHGNCGERGSTLTGNETCCRRLSVVCRQDITTNLNVRIASFILQTALFFEKLTRKRVRNAWEALLIQSQNFKTAKQGSSTKSHSDALPIYSFTYLLLKAIEFLCSPRSEALKCHCTNDRFLTVGSIFRSLNQFAHRTENYKLDKHRLIRRLKIEKDA